MMSSECLIDKKRFSVIRPSVNSDSYIQELAYLQFKSYTHEDSERLYQHFFPMTSCGRNPSADAKRFVRKYWKNCLEAMLEGEPDPIGVERKINTVCSTLAESHFRRGYGTIAAVASWFLVDGVNSEPDRFVVAPRNDVPGMNLEVLRRYQLEREERRRREMRSPGLPCWVLETLAVLPLDTYRAEPTIPRELLRRRVEAAIVANQTVYAEAPTGSTVAKWLASCPKLHRIRDPRNFFSIDRDSKGREVYVALDVYVLPGFELRSFTPPLAPDYLGPRVEGEEPPAEKKWTGRPSDEEFVKSRFKRKPGVDRVYHPRSKENTPATTGGAEDTGEEGAGSSKRERKRDKLKRFLKKNEFLFG